MAEIKVRQGPDKKGFKPVNIRIDLTITNADECSALMQCDIYGLTDDLLLSDMDVAFLDITDNILRSIKAYLANRDL